MAAGQGNKIEWSDYNEIQSIIAPILGPTPTASGTSGYGQFVSSNQVSRYAKITNTQWANLRTDILRTRQHQTGTDLTSTLAVPYIELTVIQSAIATNLLTTTSTSRLAVNVPITFVGTLLLGGVEANTTYFVKTIESSTTFTISATQNGPVFVLFSATGSMICRFGGTKITETDRAAYKALAQVAATNKLTGTTGATSIPATQSFRDTLYDDSYISAWNGILTLVSTVQFTSYDAARYFFNARGQVELRFSRTLGSGGLKNATWTTMLDPVAGMGIIYFTYNTTSSLLTNGNPGSGTGSGIGFYQLTTTNQLIFTKLAPSGEYSDNKFRIYAKLVDGNGGTGSNSCIQFQMEFRDESLNPKPNKYGQFGPFGIDEDVDGRIGSLIQTLRPSGNNVSLPVPTANIANNFSLTIVSPNTKEYSITPSVLTTDEGTTITYAITTTNVDTGTILYWTNTGSTRASDFVDGVNNGSVTIDASGTATIVRAISNDLLTEGPETVLLNLHLNSIVGPIVKSSNSINVNDTSLTPIIYTLTPNVTGTQPEGTEITFTVTLQNFGNGTLFWNNIGTTRAEDFTDGSNAGSVPIFNNSGTFVRQLRNDLLTEGSETVIMDLRVGSTNGTSVLTPATRTTITISDSSGTTAPLYKITSNFTTTGLTDVMGEGVNYIVNVETNSNTPNSPIYWAITGGLSAADLSLGSLQGSLDIVPGAMSTLRFFTRADGTTEGTKTGFLNFYSDSGYSTALPGTVSGNARTIQIADTSTNLSISPSTLNSGTAGSNFSTNFSASGGSGIYDFTISSGTSPTGISLGSSGNFSGVPRAGGTYNFTVSVRDSNNVLGSRAYSLIVAANEVLTGPTGPVSKNTDWFFRVDGGLANGTYTINDVTIGTLSNDGTVSGMVNYQGATGVFNYTFVFSSGNTRTFTVTSI